MVNKTLLKCAACNKELLATDVYCTNCGQPTKFISSPINKEALVTQDANAGTAVDANNFAYYAMDEDKILTTIIKDEIKKNGVNIFVSVKDLEKRKTVLTTLYAVILFIFISLLFFHTKIFEMFIIMLIVSFLYFGKVKKYNIIQYLKKEVKNRPDEKINYIISSILSVKINDNLIKIRAKTNIKEKVSDISFLYGKYFRGVMIDIIVINITKINENHPNIFETPPSILGVIIISKK
jgi:hypothetical protein